MVTLLLADDQATIRRGLRMRLDLEPDLSVVGEAGDGEEVLKLVSALRPDVVLMDVEMPRLDGIRATAALRTLVPETKVVVLSLHGDPATRARARAAGAAAFVEKMTGEAPLLAAIREVSGSGKPPP